MAFHAFPDTLSWDARTGDYGLNFFGHAYNTATYLIDHPTFGYLAFGGNVSEDGGLVTVTPLDSFRSRFYVAPLGLWLTLDAGEIEAVELDPATGKVRVRLAPSNASTPSARLRIEQPASITGVGNYAVNGSFTKERDATVIPLGAQPTWVELND